MTDTSQKAVERYNLYSHGVRISDDGVWVSYSDYAALAAQLEIAKDGWAESVDLTRLARQQYGDAKYQLEAANARADRARDDALVEAATAAALWHERHPKAKDVTAMQAGTYIMACIQSLRTQPTATASVELGDVLSDPNAVHINMLHGRIATSSVDQIVHIYAGKVQAISVEPVTAPTTAQIMADERVKALVDALEPFAKAADTWEPDDGDSNMGARIEHPQHGLERHAEFTFGDLRKARAALAQLKEPKP